MSELDQESSRKSQGALLGATVVALVAGLAALVWCMTLSGRLSNQQTELNTAQQANVEQAAALRETNARLRVANAELGSTLGLTQQQMDAKAHQILAREEADSKRLESAQQQTAQKVTSVSTEVSSVRSDVGGVRTDLGKTQNDVATMLSQLQSMKGDLSDHSSLIARNHNELVLLEHKGDRDYYEFTLLKGRRKVVGAVSLELKKADKKRSRFTLEINSDDRLYEKKDRNVNEPLQFYSGTPSQLYEIVVNSIDSKDQVRGYLSTPKDTPGMANFPALRSGAR